MRPNLSPPRSPRKDGGWDQRGKTSFSTTRPGYKGQRSQGDTPHQWLVDPEMKIFQSDARPGSGMLAILQKSKGIRRALAEGCGDLRTELLLKKALKNDATKGPIWPQQLAIAMCWQLETNGPLWSFHVQPGELSVDMNKKNSQGRKAKQDEIDWDNRWKLFIRDIDDVQKALYGKEALAGCGAVQHLKMLERNRMFGDFPGRRITPQFKPPANGLMLAKVMEGLQQPRFSGIVYTTANQPVDVEAQLLEEFSFLTVRETGSLFPLMKDDLRQVLCVILQGDGPNDPTDVNSAEYSSIPRVKAINQALLELTIWNEAKVSRSSSPLILVPHFQIVEVPKPPAGAGLYPRGPWYGLSRDDTDRILPLPFYPRAPLWWAEWFVDMLRILCCLDTSPSHGEVFHALFIRRGLFHDDPNFNFTHSKGVRIAMRLWLEIFGVLHRSAETLSKEGISVAGFGTFARATVTWWVNWLICKLVREEGVEIPWLLDQIATQRSENILDSSMWEARRSETSPKEDHYELKFKEACLDGALIVCARLAGTLRWDENGLPKKNGQGSGLTDNQNPDIAIATGIRIRTPTACNPVRAGPINDTMPQKTTEDGNTSDSSFDMASTTTTDFEEVDDVSMTNHQPA
ncbi:hypothetical protein P7C73_g244, partial [Tremellales sp. Uapishka_1]